RGIGMDAVAHHEADLMSYALQRILAISGLHVYGDCNVLALSKRLGVIPFNVGELSHFLVAAILGTEWGIGGRHGCFCAQPYLIRLMDVPDSEVDKVRHDILDHNRRDMPGLVRVSFGLYNTADEIDVLVQALTEISQGHYAGHYEQDSRSGEYNAVGW